MDGIREIFNFNPVLSLSVLAWVLAQVLKIVSCLVQTGKLNLGMALSSGGMPSSHSAFVCACASSVGAVYGWSSGLFAVAVVLALVVMYDAANVRQAAGQQAKILNYIMANWNQMRPEIFGEQLKELLGHTPLQVFFGAFLGVAVGLGGIHFIG